MGRITAARYAGCTIVGFVAAIPVRFTSLYSSQSFQTGPHAPEHEVRSKGGADATIFNIFSDKDLVLGLRNHLYPAQCLCAHGRRRHGGVGG